MCGSLRNLNKVPLLVIVLSLKFYLSGKATQNVESMPRPLTEKTNLNFEVGTLFCQISYWFITTKQNSISSKFVAENDD